MMEQVRQKMEKVLELLRQDLVHQLADRATPGLVERVMVEAYETRMPLVELATIAAPGPNQLLITPFDQTIIKKIEKALAMDRGLGLSPVVDENVIRVNVPPLTEERRKELVKVLHQKLEAARIMIRQARREVMTGIRQRAANKELNEDEKFQEEKELQKLTDDFNEKIASIGKVKEEELMKI